MNALLYAVGRPSDVLPYLALGARVCEVESAEEAGEAVASAAEEGDVLIILSEEFAAAAEKASGRPVLVAPGARGVLHAALEKTRELVKRSVGVDLIARAKGTGRRHG